ncbi:MAG: NADH-quinone oxidoreductase subunit A [bacterium]
MQAVSHAGALSPWAPGVFSLAAYGALVVLLTVALLALASWLGERKSTPEKLRPYESGIIPTGTARLRYPVPFYLVAIFFLIFDVEGAFIFSWAVAFPDLSLGGFLQMAFFIVLLLLGLVYIWRKGGFEWGTGRRKDPLSPGARS